MTPLYGRHPDARPVAVGEHPGKFCAEQEDLRRIVDPHEHDDERSGGAEARAHAGSTDVEADQYLPRVNRIAVTTAPIHTSAHAILTRGRMRYAVANRSVVMPKVTTVFNT